MIEVQIMIPTFANDGREFSAADNAAFEGEMKRLFAAYSRMPNVVVGEWVDDKTGTSYRDESIAYVVGVDGLLARASNLAELIAFAKSHYSQLAIYVRYLGQSEVL